MSVRSRWSGAAATVAALAAVAALTTALPLQAAAQSDEQNQLRQREVEVAAQVDALRADATEVEAALTTLEDNVTAQQGRLDDARRAIDVARGQIAATAERQRLYEDQITKLQGQLRDLALQSYVRPPSDELAVVMADASPNDAAKRKVLAGARTLQAQDVLDQLRSTREDLANAKAAAQRAAEEADRAEQAERTRLDDLDHAHQAQQQLAGDVQARLDSALSEAAGISARSAALAEEIRARESALARRVRASSGSSAGSGSRPSWVSSGVRITSVRGIEVNVSIADQLERMLAAAEADGVYLSGSGYRDIETQIQLRREHCGSSEYAIWEMDSSSCSPPVARPGYSMHEQGLAIDFVIDGDLIRSRYSSAYDWLSGNAADYGFYNLPSEPWHWSTTGS